MLHHIRRLGAMLLVLAVLCALPLSAAAEGARNTVSEDLLASVSDRTVSRYSRVTVKLGRARLAMTGLVIGDVPYLPLYELLDAFTETHMSSSGNTYRVTANGLDLTLTEGSYYLVANERYFFYGSPIVKMSDGVLYLPLETAAKVSGLGIRYEKASKTATLSGTYTPPRSGDLFYREDAVYWLSRIISAESRGEILLGQIAVGNVILNRTRNSAFPNTIYGVIFDRKYGVQFAPVSNGTIYASPAPISVIAAKICLEGYSISDRILYFYEPTHSTSSWIADNRPYIFTIGHHRFHG